MTTIFNNFEDFLRSIHADQYSGLDDDMSDDFNDWLEDSEIDWLITQADRYATYIKNTNG